MQANQLQKEFRRISGTCNHYLFTVKFCFNLLMGVSHHQVLNNLMQFFSLLRSACSLCSE